MRASGANLRIWKLETSWGLSSAARWEPTPIAMPVAEAASARRRLIAAGLGSTAGHGGDQERGLQFPPKKLQMCVDSLQRELRQGLVCEVQPLQPRGQAGGHILLEVDAQMLGFSPLDGRNFGHQGVFQCVNSTRVPVLQWARS